MRPKTRIPRQYHIAQQHHLIWLILVHLVLDLVDELPIPRRGPQLGRTLGIQPRIPMTDQRPLVLDHVGGVLVRELGGMLHPRACVSARIGMTTSVHVATAKQGHDLLVVESHAIEDLVPDVGAQTLPALDSALGIQTTADVIIIEVRTAVLLRGGQSPVTHTGPITLVGVIHSPRGEFQRGSAGVLQADVRRQYPQIGIRNLGKLSLHRLEEGARDVQSGIFGIGSLVLESHSRSVAAAGAARRIVRAAAVPSEAEEDGCQAAIVPGWIVHHVLQFGCDIGVEWADLAWRCVGCGAVDICVVG
mmetsp:Transcript_1647/g.2608  ORF Transcript_1647/g.2608 Transcript_1647/m.2608 type:complete len:304 (-) Transcript_1647:16-927(-)